MTYQKQDGDVAIFPNQGKSEKAPNHRGTFTLDGVEYEIALWDRRSGKGPFLSGKVKVKDYVSPRTGDSREKHRTQAQNAPASKTQANQWGGREIDPNPKYWNGNQVQDDSDVPF